MCPPGHQQGPASARSSYGNGVDFWNWVRIAVVEKNTIPLASEAWCLEGLMLLNQAAKSPKYHTMADFRSILDAREYLQQMMSKDWTKYVEVYTRHRGLALLRGFARHRDYTCDFV